jgi:hypothetical protein
LGFTQVIEHRAIDLPVATWFRAGAEQWPMPRLPWSVAENDEAVR